MKIAKDQYQVAFYNFRNINMLLCQLLKAIHFYRYECHPLLLFNEDELSKYSIDVALFSIAALKYPGIYREKLF